MWAFIGPNKLPGIVDDAVAFLCLLRLHSTHWISAAGIIIIALCLSAIRSSHYKSLFSARETISSLVQGVIISNVTLRKHDVEQFEDDPLEFIHLDLSCATRRQAAADVLQALVSSGYEAEATEIVGAWISSSLAEYGSNKKKTGKRKTVSCTC